MTIKLEACVGNYKEGKRAEELGANRIELCDNLAQGGTTPSYGTILQCKKDMNIDINVIIRPRGGNFVYSKEELSIMKNDIKLCKDIGVTGVVFGFLKEDNTLDYETTKEFVELAKPLSITFHMAFDEIENKVDALGKLIDLGVDRVLTKGGLDNSFKNSPNLNIFASSSGASISSNIQNGVGFASIIENNILIAVRAFSPPDKRFKFFIFFPGG